MSSQTSPSRNGIYRIKIFKQDLCIESIPQGQSATQTPWWILTRLPGGSDEWTIISAFDNTGLACKKTPETYRGHGYPHPGGQSLRWNFITFDQYSKISARENAADVLDSQYRVQESDVGPKQCFVFEFVMDIWPLSALPGRSIIPLIRPSSGAAEQGDKKSWNFGGTTEGLPNLSDVQGDIIYLFPKVRNLGSLDVRFLNTAHLQRAEHFIFFRIADVPRFRTALRRFQPSSSEDTASFVCQIAQQKGSGKSMIKNSNSQIAFTRMGMNYLGVRAATGDVRFDKFAMRDDKDKLGDQRQWDREFDKPNPDPENGSVGKDDGALHGVISVAACDLDTCKEASNETKENFGSSITVVNTVEGTARPGVNRGHEHFGYKDGMSQPALRQQSYRSKTRLLGWTPYLGEGRDNNGVPQARAIGSGLQRLPEKEWPTLERICSARTRPTLTDEEGAALWGARLVGRWKSDAPLARAPYKDDPKLATNVDMNNNFDYRISGVAGVSPVELTDRYCPFFAHIRKTVPRNLDPYIQRTFLESSMIVRAGIPYGPEVEENPEAERGLLFVCYQSSLDQGFVRQTLDFAGNVFFPITSMVPKKHGQDPIIGGPPAVTEIPFVPQVAPKSGDQVNLKFVNPNGASIEVSGFATVQPAGTADPPGVPSDYFVTSHGGEYFFVPPISTLKDWASDPERTLNNKSVSKRVRQLATHSPHCETSLPSSRQSVSVAYCPIEFRRRALSIEHIQIREF
ncbi:hypothetical protein K438DRAFT_1765670 [Mycena galopus ATCC 62051]|nr:hypothetical protein K438DRAFT_1765670 [Mycena galopus ATCC 62051]